MHITTGTARPLSVQSALNKYTSVIYMNNIEYGPRIARYTTVMYIEYGARIARYATVMYEVSSITNANGPVSQQLRNIAQKFKKASQTTFISCAEKKSFVC